MEEDTNDADKPVDSTAPINLSANDKDDIPLCREEIIILDADTGEFKEEILILETDELPELDTVTIYPPSPSPEHQDNPGLLPEQQKTPLLFPEQ